MDTIARLNASLSGRYILECQAGAGGMATVYLGTDVKHGRKVAVKVLRPELAATIGSDRFLREIETAARLIHPNILPLYDSGAVEEILYYVMPFIDGESLRDRIAREKQLPIADAVRLAADVASALDYAHRQGVIHRDIKPENILLSDGKALVADFGIALAINQTGGARLTETGLSLGTPSYMSPEQALGEREITARSDVYSLGCVTYEMLVGDPPFTGSSAQTIVAKVMTEKPVPPSTFRDTVPDNVEEAVLVALSKLPADRWATAAEFAGRLTADGSGNRRASNVQGGARPTGSGRRAQRTVALGVLIVGIALAGGWLIARRNSAAGGGLAPTRFSLLPPKFGATGAAGLHRQVTLTPDGSALVYVGVSASSGSASTLWIQRLDELEPTPIPGSDMLFSPQVSPDGKWIAAHNADGDVVRLPIGGGAKPIPIARGYSFAAWHPDGSLWFTRSPWRNVERVAPGSDSIEVRVSGLKRGVYLQQILDDGAHAIVVEGGGASSGPCLMMDLSTGRLVALLSEPVTTARYVAGYLVYITPTGVLRAAPFDARRGRVTGAAVTIAQGVSLTGAGDAQFAVARNGTLLYIPEEPRSLVFVDRAGTERDATDARRNFHAPAFSPDGRRLAVDFNSADGRDVWILDEDLRTLSRATFDHDGHDAAWSRDGTTITYTSFRSGIDGIYRLRPGSGVPAESLFASPALLYTGLWLPDGSGLVTVASDLKPGSGQDIGLVTNGGHGPIKPIIATPFRELYPALSPDGRWVAYVSDESGEWRVYLTLVRGGGDEIQISESGADEPVWGPDGHELFYRRTVGGHTELIAARLTTTPAVRVLDRKPLFSLDDFDPATPHSNYAVAPDGKSFAMVRRNPATRMVVIQNLPSLIRRLHDAPAAPR